MNLPNRLTIARFFLTLGFVVSMSVAWPFSATVALVLFILGTITDYADGYIARRYSMITDFGKLMDPLVDKIMVAGAFICLIPAIPAWAVVVIISREFLITGLRLLAASKGVVLPAESVGKHKTGWQIATVIFFLLALSIREMGGLSLPKAWIDQALYFGGNTLIAIALILTLYSGVGYLWRNRGLLETAA
ncbi:MAG TPA: CDP-diacylglycerol--glycerol-3-phosphate 3-phosphatidyltransferase [Chthoniobacteraceae bacterium]|nr:CDP-diacylglycerol--glycerol-3-phosphate 3-phosphatidyltransferase [Chthoniobacteraceae bacterium]